MKEKGGTPYSLASSRDGIIAVDVAKGSIPALLFQYADTKSSGDSVMITRRLPVSFGPVLKWNGQGQGEDIVLKGGGVEVVLPRDSDVSRQQPGWMVLREIENREIRAHFVHVKFRESTDLYVDSGFLWLRGGSPAEVILVLNFRALSLTEPDLLAVLDEAEKFVEDKILVHFRSMLSSFKIQQEKE